MKFRDIKIGSIVEFDLERGYRGAKALNMRFSDEEFLGKESVGKSNR